MLGIVGALGGVVTVRTHGALAPVVNAPYMRAPLRPSVRSHTELSRMPANVLEGCDSVAIQ